MRYLSNSGNNFLSTSQGVSDSKTLGDCGGKSSGVVRLCNVGNSCSGRERSQGGATSSHRRWVGNIGNSCSGRSQGGATSSHCRWVGDISEVPIRGPHLEMTLGHMSMISSFRNCCESCESGSEEIE